MTKLDVLNRIVDLARRVLRSRQQAYRTVFNRQAIDARIVLADLAKFCRAHVSTGDKDPQIAARLDGRREVWLRIQRHVHMTDEELWDHHKPKGVDA